MIGKIKKICRIWFIGNDSCGPTPATVVWDEGVPWDNSTGWR